MANREITLRRNLQQIVHCAQEALSVIENDEDMNCAIDDLQQASQLINDTVLPKLRKEVSEPRIARRPI